ncbi:hypothetical protein [Sphingomonas immobilis]|uniref:Uncharacterized protein n=1 Tax=Sphingomonas immobilis TaxID=3063997 RepID=A0ABT8ZVQ0_9SPHN|nr:hypothetical protein [Sphingomonas sp. CA1-15]MDO7841648.1 hypothetical protein [Sphingomonas sp. CA1-15]
MADPDLERMKRFLGIAATEVMGVPADSEIHPSRVLAEIEVRHGKSKAKAGLKMAINDIVEMTGRYGHAETLQFDAILSAQDAMTLSQARAYFSKRLKAIRKRGEIASEAEYYMVRNAVEALQPDEAGELNDMLSAFEQRVERK